MDESRYLITTDLEETWKFDQPVIFLGDWCLKYSRRHIWEKMDAITAKPYGLGLKKKDTDYLSARKLEKIIFPYLCIQLNNYHKTKHTERFWQILLGHWLRIYIDVMVNRINTLEECVRDYELSGTTTFLGGNQNLATENTLSFLKIVDDSYWNNALNIRILELLYPKKIKLNYVPKNNSTINVNDRKQKTSIFKRVVKRTFFGLANFLVKNSDAFIYNSYLPRLEALKLQVLFKQIPMEWESTNFSYALNPNQMTRRVMSNDFLINTGIKSDQIIVRMLFEIMPTCYLEDFESLCTFAKTLKWPSSPKFIFTSNSFYTDEVFKVWAAHKTELNTPYFVGQHGNNYGTSRYMNPSVEEVTSDKFLTWGWEDKLPQHTPTFIFKGYNNKKNILNLAGSLLIVEQPLHERSFRWDETNEYKKYFEEQKIFISNLSQEPKNSLLIRMHAMSKSFGGWEEDLRWKDFNSSLKIDDGTTEFEKLINISKLVVYSYDSTGILELLNRNIPVVAFWQNGLDNLRDSAQPNYNLLLNAGLIHFSPISISIMINKIWGDIDSWWQQDIVQIARNEFCNHYAKESKTPLRDLKNTLLSK